MRILAGFLGFAVLPLMLSGCGRTGALVYGAASQDADKEIRDACGTTYEIFVYSYADSDGDGIGDLNGIRENLDVLNDGDPATRGDLGVNAIWMTPVFPSPTYHKYDATDYCSVDPAFGTLEDLDALLADCHARGMRVYLDLALNHTSSEHPWFQEAAAFLSENPPEDLSAAGSAAASTDASGGVYEMPASYVSACPRISFYNFSTQKGAGYEPLRTASGAESGWTYEARFWSGMPDLNLDSQAVREEIEGILAFWLARGVDGFRLDAVTSYYTEDHAKSAEFLAWLTETADRIGGGKHVYMVGEAWENQQAYASFYETGVDSFFDFAFAGQEGVIAQTVRSGKSADKFAQQMAEEETLYAALSNGRSINAPFYTNHDMARSAGYYAQDNESRVKLAFALNLLQTGNAFVYYGEELGMKGSGKDENKRAPFPWTDGSGSGGSKTLTGQGSNPSKAVKGDMLCAGPPDMDTFDAAPFGSLAKQKKDGTSVWNTCREAIHLRARHPLIARGRTVLFPEDSVTGKELAAHAPVCGFMRTAPESMENGASADAEPTDAGASAGVDTDNMLRIFVNTGAEPQTLALGNDAGETLCLLDSLTVTGERVKLSSKGGKVDTYTVKTDGCTLYLPGYSIAVLE